MRQNFSYKVMRAYQVPGPEIKDFPHAISLNPYNDPELVITVPHFTTVLIYWKKDKEYQER